MSRSTVVHYASVAPISSLPPDIVRVILACDCIPLSALISWRRVSKSWKRMIESTPVTLTSSHDEFVFEKLTKIFRNIIGLHWDTIERLPTASILNGLERLSCCVLYWRVAFTWEELTRLTSLRLTRVWQIPQILSRLPVTDLKSLKLDLGTASSLLDCVDFPVTDLMTEPQAISNDDILRFAASMRATLRRLTISDIHLRSNPTCDFSPLTQLTKLEHLSLQIGVAMDEKAEIFSKMTFLRSVGLGPEELSFADVATFHAFTAGANFEEFDWRINRSVKESEYLQLLCDYPRLRSIRCAALPEKASTLSSLESLECSSWTPRVLKKALLQSKNTIRTIQLHASSPITQQEMAILQRCSSAQEISLTGHAVLPSLDALAWCSALTRLDLSKSSGVNDESLSTLLRKATQLRDLALRACKLSGECFGARGACSSLTSLCIHSSHITPNGSECIRKLPQLRRLELTDMPTSSPSRLLPYHIYSNSLRVLAIPSWDRDILLDVLKNRMLRELRITWSTGDAAELALICKLLEKNNVRSRLKCLRLLLFLESTGEWRRREWHDLGSCLVS